MSTLRQLMAYTVLAIARSNWGYTSHPGRWQTSALMPRNIASKIELEDHLIRVSPSAGFSENRETYQHSSGVTAILVITKARLTKSSSFRSSSSRCRNPTSIPSEMDPEGHYVARKCNDSKRKKETARPRHLHPEALP